MEPNQKGGVLDMDGLINQMGEIRVSCVSREESEHAAVCAEVVSILYALLDGGAHDIETAKDIIRDYNSLAKQYQAMYKRFGEAGHPVHKDGVWHCPSCNRRVYPGCSFCRYCGKKLEWDPLSRKGVRR